MWYPVRIVTIMKTPSTLIFGALALAGCTCLLSVSVADDVREWRSTNGKSVRGELIGVRDGKAIIRPETKLIEAPLSKLRETDREYVIKWGKRQEKFMADRAEADLLLAKSRPLGKALIGRTVIVNGRSVENFEIKNISKIEYVLIYFAREDAIRHIDELNRLYKRLKNRYDNFEFIALIVADTKAENDAVLVGEKVQFPAVRSGSLNTDDTKMLSQLYQRQIVPQPTLPLEKLLG